MRPTPVKSAAQIRRSRARRWLLAGALAVAAALVGLRCWFPRAQVRVLADGTEVFWRRGTSVDVPPTYPRPRLIRVDGDVFIRAHAGPQPLLIRSRLLALQVEDDAEVRVTAFARETGEEAEVLRGRVVAAKAYPSAEHEPDVLAAGEMVMVNRTIDLMEPENDDPAALALWAAELEREATGPRRLR